MSLNKILVFIPLMILLSCNEKVEQKESYEFEYQKNILKTKLNDSLIQGKTYLPIYSEVYSKNMKTKYLTTATASIRNTNLNDTIYINKIEYYNTEGDLVRKYLDETIFIRPMETKEIVIDYVDKQGGTGANFYFEWSCNVGSNKPFFQAVMVTISGSFGLSFTTDGIDIK